MAIRYLLITLFISVSSSSYAQTIMTNKQPIDPKRYGDVRGTPYYYDDPVEARLYITNEDKPYDVRCNINLHEHIVEVYDGGKYTNIAWRDLNYLMTNDSTFIKKVNGELILILHAGEKYKLSNTPKISIEKKELRPPGSIVIRETFNKKDYYVLTVESINHDISLNKKSLEKVLGKEAIKLAKNNKNNLKTEQDVVSLLRLLEER